MWFQKNCGHRAQQQLYGRWWKPETTRLNSRTKDGMSQREAWIEPLNGAFYIHFFPRLKSANSCSKQHLYGLVLSAIYTLCLHHFIFPLSLSHLFSTSSSLSIIFSAWQKISPTYLLECHSSIPFSLIFNHLRWFNLFHFFFRVD